MENKNKKTQMQKLQAALVRRKTRHFFTASVSSHRTVPPHHTVVYDNVVYSIGGGYNPATGEFTCPTAGMYRFDLGVMTQPLQSLNVWIEVFNVRMVRTVADGASGFPSACNQLEVHLDKGDVVKVTSGEIVSYLHGGTYNTFTGVMTSQD